MSVLTLGRCRRVTAKTAVELGLRVDVVASEYTVKGLVRAIRESYRG